MKQKAFCIFLVIPVVICSIFLSFGKAYATDSFDFDRLYSEKQLIGNSEKAIVISNGQGNGNYSFWDATDSLVFFSYSEQTSQVDAYDYNGTYKYTISLAYRDRGSVSIRCQDNLLYIKSKYGNVFVFDEKEQINMFSSEDSKSNGYTETWFQQRSVPVKNGITKFYRYRLAEESPDVITKPKVIFLHTLKGHMAIGVVFISVLATTLKLRKRIHPQKIT